MNIYLVSYISLGFSDHIVSVHAFLAEQDITIVPWDGTEIPYLSFDVLSVDVVVVVDVVAVVAVVAAAAPTTAIATFVNVLCEVLTELDKVILRHQTNLTGVVTRFVPVRIWSGPVNDFHSLIFVKTELCVILCLQNSIVFVVLKKGTHHRSWNF